MRNKHRLRASSFDLLSTYNYFTPGWIDFLWIGISLFIGLLLSGLVGIALNKAGFEPIYIQLISYPILFIPSMLLASSLSRRNMFRDKENPLDKNNYWSVKQVLIAAISMLAAGFVIDGINLILPPMPEDFKEVMLTLKEGPVWVSILCVGIFAPFMEEWLCRGIILRGLLGKINAPAALIISALFFGVIHGNIWQGAPAFFIGILLGFIYYKSGSLKLTMWMHAIHNLVALTLMKIPSLEAAETYFDIFPSVWTYGIAMTASIVITTLTVIYFARLKRPEEVSE